MAGKDLVWALEEIGLRSLASDHYGSPKHVVLFIAWLEDTIRWFVFGLIVSSRVVTEANIDRSRLADVSSVIPAC